MEFGFKIEFYIFVKSLLFLLHYWYEAYIFQKQILTYKNVEKIKKED